MTHDERTRELALARRRLLRIKLATVAASVTAFAGLSAEVAWRTNAGAAQAATSSAAGDATGSATDGSTSTGASSVGGSADGSTPDGSSAPFVPSAPSRRIVSAQS